MKVSAKLGRKGISPIVATVLLVLIAIAAGVVIWNMFSKVSTARPIVALSARADAVMSPDGDECAVSIMLHNDGNVVLNITQIDFEYAGKTWSTKPNRVLNPGATISLSYTLSSSYFGTKFVDGETIKIKITYADAHGETYTKTIFATITSS